MSSKTWIALLVIILIFGGVFLYFQALQNKTITNPLPTAVSTPSPSPQGGSPTSAEQTQKNTVTITDNGFFPAEITIKVGDSVTWMNSDSSDHQINSAPHPTHTTYPPLNTVGLIKPGESKSLTFPTAGTYKYHDHLNPQNTGTVIVE